MSNKKRQRNNKNKQNRNNKRPAQDNFKPKDNVVISEIEYTDGITVKDLSEKAEITGEIDNHFGTLLKGVVLSSIMGSATAITTNRKNDWRGVAAEGAGEQIVNIGNTFAEKALSRQPTISIEPGERFNIMVHSDLILEPYGE